MQSHKSKPELEKLEKELIILKQKVNIAKVIIQCVDLETDRVARAQHRKENLANIEDEINSLEKNNEDLISQGEILNYEYENLLSNKETNYEEIIEREEKILEELKEKNNFLNSEVLFFSENFIYLISI